MSAASFVASSSVAAGPSHTNLFIDVGANNYNRLFGLPGGLGHGMAEYARIEREERNCTAPTSSRRTRISTSS